MRKIRNCRSLQIPTETHRLGNVARWPALSYITSTSFEFHSIIQWSIVNFKPYLLNQPTCNPFHRIFSTILLLDRKRQIAAFQRQRRTKSNPRKIPSFLFTSLATLPAISPSCNVCCFHPEESILSHPLSHSYGLLILQSREWRP